MFPVYFLMVGLTPFCPSETPILLFEVLLSLAGGVDALGCIAAHDETLTVQKQAQRSFP